MKADQVGPRGASELRPEWRGFMLFFLRSVVCPIANGKIPNPPHSKGDQTPIALLDTAFREEVPLESSLGYYEITERVLAHLREKLTLRDIEDAERLAIQKRVEGGQLWWGGISFHSGWISAFNETNYLGKDWWFLWSWHTVLNIGSSLRWGIPFPILLHVAKEGPEPVALDALCRCVTVEKTVITLPWFVERLEKAKAENNQRFMKRLGQAIAAIPVPQKLQAHIVDVFLCLFDVWLRELSIQDQIALFKEGGLEITPKTLRNRRSHLKLSKIGDERQDEIVHPLIQERMRRSEKIFTRAPEDYKLMNWRDKILGEVALLYGTNPEVIREIIGW